MGSEANRSVAALPKEPPMNGGLSGPALDDIAERQIKAAKKGTPVRLSDVQTLVVHMHSTEAYAALRSSAYVNNTLGLELLRENRALREALRGVVAVADRNTVEFENARAALASNGTASAQAPSGSEGEGQ